jgi:hypothetical protein
VEVPKEAPSLDASDSAVPSVSDPVAVPSRSNDLARWEKLIEQFVGKSAADNALGRLDKIDMGQVGKHKFKGDGFEAGNSPINVSVKFAGKDLAFEISGKIPLTDLDWMNQTFADTVVDGAQAQSSGW